jgi:formate dehydrogenase major subunit
MGNPSYVPSVCPYCGVGCGLFIEVNNGIATGIQYMKDHPTNEGALCPKGNSTLDIIYNRERLQFPLKRVDNHFERASWEEAISLVTENLGRIRDESGPDALAFLASAKATNEENYLFQKMARMMGTNNIDHCARL